MEVIKLRDVIKRPKGVVETALLEGLSIHRDLGYIVAFKYDAASHLHYVELDSSFWPQDFIDPFITIQLTTVCNSEIHTEFKSTLNFTYVRTFSISRFLRIIILRESIKHEALNRLHQFKHRIEKWL